MSMTEQLPMQFRGPAPAPGEAALFLGLVVDHHRLFDALQEEWLPPPPGATGHLLGVRAFAGPRRADLGADSHRILAYLRLDAAQIPPLTISAFRGGHWIATTASDVRVTDEAVFWPGMLPTFAIQEILVSGREEGMRLAGLARQVSNVDLPGGAPSLLQAEPPPVTAPPPPAEPPPALAHPAGYDAVRGAMTMALRAVPRMEPYLDLLCAALYEPAVPSSLVAQVEAPWWSRAPWSLAGTPTKVDSLDEALWLGASAVLGTVREPLSAVQWSQAIADAAVDRASPQVNLAPLNSWLAETRQLLRGEARIDIDSWRANPVGRSLQLTLLRPEPERFKRWVDDLPRLPPGLFWSAATLCGLWSGYRRLPLGLRGEPALRRLISYLALRATARDVERFWPGGAEQRLGWRLGAGDVLFMQGSEVLAQRHENGRGKWLRADLGDPLQEQAARALASRLRWPCLCTELFIDRDPLILLGEQAIPEVSPQPPRGLRVTGTFRMRLPASAEHRQVLDYDAFRRCILTEGGAEIPAPPQRTQRSPEHRLSVTAGEERPAYGASPEGHRPPAVPGLLYVPGFLDEEEERKLVAAIDAGEWRKDLTRRVQHYGYRYDYKARQVDASMKLGDLPAWASHLAQRLADQGLMPHLADQAIVNEYVGDQGIAKHMDCVPCFADGVAVISLLESWEMVFREQAGKRKISQILERRSVMVLTGEARFRWTHEIPRRLHEPSGPRGRRLSVTFRKVNLAQEIVRPAPRQGRRRAAKEMVDPPPRSEREQGS